MEEGPEPQEWVERAAEEHHHKHEHGSSEKRPEMMTSAITAAVLAVLAAIGSLLSGHAANHAILGQTKASDQWAYFQSVSTRGHLYEVNAELLESLTASDKMESIRPKLTGMLAKSKEYDLKKEEIKKEAERLTEESGRELEKHNRFSVGIASFQVGIVLASVSILVQFRALYYLSLVAGLGGLVMLAMGLLG
jgi:Domain of unknown function (DUF4337)